MYEEKYTPEIIQPTFEKVAAILPVDGNLKAKAVAYRLTSGEVDLTADTLQGVDIAKGKRVIKYVTTDRDEILRIDPDGTLTLVDTKTKTRRELEGKLWAGKVQLGAETMLNVVVGKNEGEPGQISPFFDFAGRKIKEVLYRTSDPTSDSSLPLVDTPYRFVDSKKAESEEFNAESNSSNEGPIWLREPREIAGLMDWNNLESMGGWGQVNGSTNNARYVGGATEFQFTNTDEKHDEKVSFKMISVDRKIAAAAWKKRKPGPPMLIERVLVTNPALQKKLIETTGMSFEDRARQHNCFFILPYLRAGGDPNLLPHSDLLSQEDIGLMVRKVASERSGRS